MFKSTKSYNSSNQNHIDYSVLIAATYTLTLSEWGLDFSLNDSISDLSKHLLLNVILSKTLCSSLLGMRERAKRDMCTILKLPTYHSSLVVINSLLSFREDCFKIYK